MSRSKDTARHPPGDTDLIRRHRVVRNAVKTARDNLSAAEVLLREAEKQYASIGGSMRFDGAYELAVAAAGRCDSMMAKLKEETSEQAKERRGR